MKKMYYVSLSDGVFVEANNPDDAVEMAMLNYDPCSLEAEVYEVKENGEIGWKVR